MPEGYSFGHQVSVAVRDDPKGPRAGAAGWSGGTGTLGIADPAAERTVVLLTNRGLDGPLGTGALDACLADLWSDVTGSADDRVAAMLRVGLTGGIGSGKSTVSAQLASLGAVVVDADAVAREVVEPGMPALAAVVDRFGPDVVDRRRRPRPAGPRPGRLR